MPESTVLRTLIHTTPIRSGVDCTIKRAQLNKYVTHINQIKMMTLLRILDNQQLLRHSANTICQDKSILRMANRKCTTPLTDDGIDDVRLENTGRINSRKDHFFTCKFYYQSLLF